MDVLGELLDGINFISSRQSKHGEKAKKESLQVLIKGIAGYIAGSSDGGK